MKTTHLTQAALVAALGFTAACENSMPTAHDPHPPGEEPAHEALTVVFADAFLEDGSDPGETYFEAPPLLVDTPSTRVGVMGRLKSMGEFGDAGLGGLIEVRGQTDDGTWLGWRAVEITFQEDTMFNAMTDFEQPVTLAELRMPRAALGQVGAIGWELFNVASADGEPDDIGNGIDLQGVGQSEQGLSGELSDLGIVTRSQWGAQSPRCTPYESNKWRFAIHHTAGALAIGVSDGKTIVKGTQNYHRNTRGWCDIAYHFAVGSDGTIYEARQLGLKGGHTSGTAGGVSNNTGNIGIVMLGCFNNASGCNHPVSNAMINAAGKLAHRLADMYGIVRSTSTVKGHKQHTNTTITSCPGTGVLNRLSDIRTWSPAPDTSPPVLSGNIWRSTSTVGGTLWVGFNQPVDDVGVTKIRVQAGNKTVTKAYTGTNKVSIDGLRPYHTYTVKVWAIDAAGNKSAVKQKNLKTGAFSDVVGKWYEDAVKFIGEEGITNGCNPPANTNYCPGNDVTRAQMATFLTRALDLPGGPDAFSDDDGSVHESAINAIAAAGITSGCGNGAYCPDAPIKRGQLAAFLKRALNLPAGPDAFSDDNDSQFENDINALAAAGITNGCGDGVYCPNDPVSRAQMAAFLSNALQ